MQEIEFFDILLENLSNESKWFLFILQQEEQPINKELLKDMANESYSKRNTEKGITSSEPLIPSRHLLDIHTARLEGAGLVQVQKVGRIRMYSITPLGKKLLKYATS